MLIQVVLDGLAGLGRDVGCVPEPEPSSVDTRANSDKRWNTAERGLAVNLQLRETTEPQPIVSARVAQIVESESRMFRHQYNNLCRRIR